MDTTKVFGNIVKLLRNNVTYNGSLGMSLRLLSEKSGISHSFISQIENNKRAIPRPKTIKALSQGLASDYPKDYDLFFYQYLMSMAGYWEKDAHNVRIISNILNIPFQKFLVSSGYSGMVDLDASDETNEKTAQQTWKTFDKIDEQSLQFQKEITDQTIYLDELYDKNKRLVLANKELSSNERRILLKDLDIFKSYRNKTKQWNVERSSFNYGHA